ncbi:MAG: peptidase P60 [Bradyrhizobium sp.]|nr:MAG: peptidase P60 [Bradyrhizobium sp.]
MSPPLFDPRVTPARPDLAAEFLRGRVQAERFVTGEAWQVVAAKAQLRRAPDAEAALETEALRGEAITVYDKAGDWRWVQLARDGYVGYLPADALGSPRAPTHRIAALRAHAYPDKNIKRPPRLALSLGALVDILRFDGDFAVTGDNLWIYARHIAPLDTYEPDFVAVAERFLEVPYLWGGRTSEGIDCSGLVQTALAAAGIAAPRDSDMMEAALGAPVPITADGTGLKRGDLIFWKGHVGVMRDANELLHANGWAMKAASEPLATARSRIEENNGGAVTAIRRL